MKTASDTLFERPAPRAPAHLKRRPRSGPRSRRYHGSVPGLSHRRWRRANRLAHRAVPISTPVAELVLPAAPVEDQHETAIESPMPAISQRAGLRLYSALTLPVAVLVACIYIGVPLALFTHDFSNHRLLATLVASTLVFAAAFGGVLRVLRTTTKAPDTHPGPEGRTARDERKLASAGFTRGSKQQGEHPRLAEA